MQFICQGKWIIYSIIFLCLLVKILMVLFNDPRSIFFKYNLFTFLAVALIFSVTHASHRWPALSNTTLWYLYSITSLHGVKMLQEQISGTKVLITLFFQ